MAVTERTLGTLGMDWGGLLNSFGLPGAIGKRPDEINWKRPAPVPMVKPRQTKVCKNCGETFERPPTCSSATWSDRKCCSAACANDRRRSRKPTATETRPCAGCPVILVRGHDTPARWARRRYHSRPCMNAHRLALKGTPADERARARDAMRRLRARKRAEAVS